MIQGFRFSMQVIFACVLALLLVACSSASAGLNSFQSPDGRYGFLFPTGWTRVDIRSGGPQIVFHDLINADETLSLVVSKVESDIDLEELGSPELVGERLVRGVVPNEGAGRDVELVSAEERNESDHIFYDLEYSVHSQDRDRHELATVVVDRGFLYTFAASTNEERWPKVKGLFKKVIGSFVFLV